MSLGKGQRGEKRAERNWVLEHRAEAGRVVRSR